MSIETINLPRDKLEAMAFGRMEFDEFSQYMDELQALLGQTATQHQAERFTYSSKQATNCAGCGLRKHTPLRVDDMGGYVCLTCIDNRLGELLEAEQYQGEPVAVVIATGGPHDTEDRVLAELQAELPPVGTKLYTRPATQHRGEPVGWYKPHWNGKSAEWRLGTELTDAVFPEMWEPLYTHPAEQPEPISSTSDKYKAELYDEVWQLARDMGFGNVTDALMKLQSQLQSEPPSYKPGLYAVRHIDNWDGERDIALTFANLDADGKWTDSGTGDALLAYRGDKILRAWPLDCSDAPGAQIIGVPRNWLEDWALELVEAAQDGGQMSNQVEHLLQLHPKQ